MKVRLSCLTVGKVLSPGFLLAAGLVIGLLPGTASATPVNGSANTGGSVNVFAGGATPGIFFFNVAGTVANTFDAGPAAQNIGSYAGLTGGTIKNLTGNPVTGAISISDFMTFVVAAGTIHFDLQNINPGTGTAAACGSNAIGSVCTPTGSPFTLKQTATGVTIDLSLNGIAYLGTIGSGTSPTGGLFTAQTVVNGGTISGVLAQISPCPQGQSTGCGGLIGQTYSATFSSTVVPEPGSLTMLLAGLGLLAIGLVTKRAHASRA